MKPGFASPFYGKLGVASLPSEVKTIWYSRDAEPPELPRHGWSWEQAVETDIETPDLICKILAATPLTPRESAAIYLHIVEEYTLDECGEFLDCTRERVRQIVAKGLRRLRTHQASVTGIRPDSIDPEVSTWSSWQWAKRSIHR
jgi:hypothetical protein